MKRDDDTLYPSDEVTEEPETAPVEEAAPEGAPQDEPEPMPGPTPEEIAETEREAAKAREAQMAPYHNAARLRRETADIAAEHDHLISELLFNEINRELEV